MDPERVHDSMVRTGQALGRHKATRSMIKLMFDSEHPMLEQTIYGIHFKNPLGLAAGFDKNAQLTRILPSVSFGYEEVGSITGEACLGNTGTRLWRLKKSKGLVVYYGLKNDGAEVLATKLASQAFEFPVGISVAKTNNRATVDTQTGIDDYVKAYTLFKNIGSYDTINISCPNTFGGEPFTDPEKLNLLLGALGAVRSPKPMFIKLSPDLSHELLDELVEVALKHNVNGFVCTNLTKNRDNIKIQDTEVPRFGGISGQPVQKLSGEMIRWLYKKTKGQKLIIGCGGIFTAEDAYKKIKAGASLLQLITGMIFEGPQVLSQINTGLEELLKANGYTHISEAIGTD